MSALPSMGVKTDANVLTLNSGSSSLKFGMYQVKPLGLEVLLSDEVDFSGENTKQPEAMIQILHRLANSGRPSPAAIGHRIVHGGPKLRRHCLIDDEVLHQLEAAVPFAPLHMPATLSIMQLAREHFPGIPQVACFDTAFHADLPDVARVLPIPKELRSEGIERYGFHGLSCESILHQLGDDLPDRVAIAHLGNGASVTAVKGGKSIDTSMGLTPTGGLVMGTRCGDIDPGVLVYLTREKKYDADTLEDMVDRQSGLLGISGVSSDMRRLHEAASTDANARLAIQIFCYSVRKQIAGMIAALEGVDLIVFTGGIGENDAQVRATICAGLTCAGIRLDDARNRTFQNPISAPRSPSKVLVLSSKEDEQIARHSWALLPPNNCP